MTPPRAVIWVSVSTAPQAADDKLSLPTQEQAARELCARMGWQPVDVLVVDGHSRRYIDIRECARDMEKAGITAFTRLMDHWKARDFDVLIVRDASRFARTQALHAYVVESTIDAGASIYSLQDGPIDETNYRMWTAMTGYAAASEMDRLRKLNHEAAKRGAARGLPIQRLPVTHRKIRNERGKAVAIDVDPDQRDLYTRAGELLLAGVPWARLGIELRDRFGLVNRTTGAPHLYTVLYKTFRSPPFWGHAAVGIEGKRGARGRHLWMIDAAYVDSVPGTVQMNYDVLPPVLTGDFAGRVKAEIVRRMTTGRRKWDTTEPRMFSGLLVCPSCGYRFTARVDHYTAVDGVRRDYPSYRCTNAFRQRVSCDNCTSIRESAVQAYIDTILRRLPADPDMTALTPPDDIAARQLEHVERTIADIDARLRRTALRLSETDDPAIIASINDVLHDLAEQKRQTERARAALMASVPSEAEQQAFRRSLDAVRGVGIDRLWRLPPLKINQLLHQLFTAKRCIAVLDGACVGIIDVRRRSYRAP